MAKILSFALLAICVLQIVSASPLFGFSSFGQLADRIKDKAEDLMEDVVSSSSKALRAAQNGISKGLQTFEVKLKSAGRTVSNGARAGLKWAGWDKDEDSSEEDWSAPNYRRIQKPNGWQKPAWQKPAGDKRVTVDASIALEINGAHAVNEFKAAVQAEKKAEEDLQKATVAAAAGDVAGSKALTEAAIEKDLEAADHAQDAAKAAIAAGLDISQVAQEEAQSVLVYGADKADEALQIADQTIAAEAQIAAQGERQLVEVAEDAVNVAQGVSETFDEVIGDVISTENEINQEHQTDIQETRVIADESKNTLEQALNTVADVIAAQGDAAVDHVQTAIESGDEDTVQEALDNASKIADEVDTKLAVLATAQEAVKAEINDGLTVLDNVQDVAGELIDAYAQVAKDAKETTDAEIKPSLAEAEANIEIAEIATIEANLQAAESAQPVEAPAQVDATLAVAAEPAQPVEASAQVDATVAAEPAQPVEAPAQVDATLAVAAEPAQPVEAPAQVDATLAVAAEPAQPVEASAQVDAAVAAEPAQPVEAPAQVDATVKVALA